jgi:hypothetical protein
MKILGYTIVNPSPLPYISQYPLVCTDRDRMAQIYPDYLMAQEQRDRMAEENENYGLVVVQVIQA